MSKNINKVSKLRISSQGMMQSEAIQRYLDGNTDALNDISSCPILNGRLIEDISIATGVKETVKHGLGRQYKGIIISLTNGTITSWEVDSSNKRKTTELQLTITGTATLVSLWVY